MTKFDVFVTTVSTAKMPVEEYRVEAESKFAACAAGIEYHRYIHGLKGVECEATARVVRS